MNWESVLLEVAKSSPGMAFGLAVLAVLWKMTEQKVAMAQRMAQREKEMGDQCEDMLDRYYETTEKLRELLNRNNMLYEQTMALLGQVQQQLQKPKAK